MSHSTSRSRLPLAIIPLLVGLAGCVNRDSVELTAADSADIYITALQQLEVEFPELTLDSAPRLWVIGVREEGGQNLRPLSSQVWDRMAEEWPQAETASELQDVMECPPGKIVGMPGDGCPIREEGIIVWFHPLVKEGDSRIAVPALDEAIINAVFCPAHRDDTLDNLPSRTVETQTDVIHGGKDERGWWNAWFAIHLELHRNDVSDWIPVEESISRCMS